MKTLLSSKQISEKKNILSPVPEKDNVDKFLPARLRPKLIAISLRHEKILCLKRATCYSGKILKLNNFQWEFTTEHQCH